MNVPTLTTQFLDRAETYYSDVTGVIADDGTEYTYGDVVDRVNRLSNALLELGVEQGDRVAAVTPNTHWCIEAVFATQQIGGIFTPLNYRLVPDDYEYLLSDSGATVVLVDYEYADKIDGIREAVPAESFVCYRAEQADGEWLDYESLLEEAAAEQPERPEIDEDDDAAINYTSGTTGDPKGVVRTHRTDFMNAISHAYKVNFKDDGVYLWTLPMFHVHGWGALYMVTGVGGTHVCLRDFSAEAVFERIREYDVSYLSGAPTVLNRLLEHNEATDDLVTAGENDVTISTAAASPPTSTIKSIEDDFGWELIHFYGHTESGPYTTSNSPARIAEEGRMKIKPKQGIPTIGNHMRVVDEDGNDVPRDDQTIGEIILKGNLVFDRYWNKPEKTEQAFNDRVEGWFHGGDLGTVDENGFITLKDRKKDIIISGGENISSLEIEDAIYDLDGVSKATVIPVPHDEWGETPKALVVTTPGADLTEDDVIAHCKDVLAGYKAPTSVEIVDELPTNATGKVQKHELREQYWEDEDRLIGGG
jgi:fatty-acyl-CoA synthase